MLPAAEIEFVGQAEQVADPAFVLYCPAAHAEQVETPLSPVYPALHMQILAIEPMTCEYFPGPQDVHSAELVAVLKVPARQSRQTSPPNTTLYLPAAQSRQFVCEVAPNTLEYLPGTHFMHVITPVVAFC